MSVVRVDENVDTLDFASCIQHKLSVNKDVLNQHECTLIDHLGGLDVVMCLCLSNPELKKYVNKESFHCLTTLLKWNGIIDDDNTCNNMHAVFQFNTKYIITVSPRKRNTVTQTTNWGIR